VTEHDGSFGDPMTEPFWEAASRHEYVIQRCSSCGRHQSYPRPFCIACQSDDVSWIRASGKGTIYSQTIVRVEISPERKPPYTVAIVELAEGPRVLSTIEEGPSAIGAEVEVVWSDRAGLPPLPTFRPLSKEDP
jgi:uncharacterized protein